MTKLTQEQIDNYHAGKMNQPEMADFERTLESDPAVRAESDFQSDIVSGLKEYRKLELKSRLDAINVGPTWFEFAQQSTLMKSLGGVIVASLIGTGILIYGEKPETQDLDQLATVEAPNSESFDFVFDLGEEKENKSLVLEKPSEAPKETFQEEIVDNTTEASTVETSTKEDATEKAEVFKPAFEAPNADLVEEETEFSTTGLDEIPDNSNSDISNDPIDVQSEISKNSTIKYKYYDGKLFLNGNFDKAPYEILEINNAKGRRIYVYYLDKYYKVGIADKLTELPQVTNPVVIKELKLLRENK